MSEVELIQKIDKLKSKLHNSQKRLTGFQEKAKQLEMQYHDSRSREQHTNDLVMELIERQRELNVMLNRSNIMLNRTQEVMALTSIEFNDMTKALPEPKKAEFSERIAKINELFKKTGIQDAEMLSLENGNSSDSLRSDELKKESEEAFRKKESIWDRKEQPQPPQVEAELIEDDLPQTTEQKASIHEEINVKFEASGGEETEEEVDSQQQKTWWKKLAG